MVSTGMHMTELATRLAEHGWDLTVYTARPSWWSERTAGDRIPREMTYAGVRVRRVPTVGSQRGGAVSKALAGLSFVVSAAAALVRHPRFDGMIVTTNPPFVGLLGWLSSRLLRRPYLFIVYDVFPEFAISLGALPADSPVARAWHRLTRLILSGAAVIVVIGRDMEDLIRRKLPGRLHDRIVLIPNWSDERRVRPVPREENAFRREHGLEGRFVVQYAGRLGEKHNLEPLVEAAALLRDTHVLFQFVGDGAKRPRLQRLAARLGLANVAFLPYQPLDRLAETLSAADLAVVCLETGHTGISVPSKAYGVMAAGRPILGILDPEGEIGQMVKETGCGVLVEPDAEEIARTIRSLMEDGEALAAMGEAGRRAFLERYTLAQAAAAYDAALRSMLGA
jgi:glycosyltransferase involved in cell wall biosynthesis